MSRNKKPIPQDLRQAVFKRDNYTCQYCGDTTGPFQADHVYPESKGGETSIDNLTTACRRCNGRKQARVGIWPRKIVTIVETVTETETITVMKNPVVGRWVMFIAVQVLVAGIIYGGFTHTNILIASPVAAMLFLVGFALILLGV
jgi:hypothetical protein